jgi:hypothetical protein
MLLPRFAGLDYPAALAVLPEGYDRGAFLTLLKAAEAGLYEASLAQRLDGASDGG